VRVSMKSNVQAQRLQELDTAIHKFVRPDTNSKKGLRKEPKKRRGITLPIFELNLYSLRI
jgi:hypothetical protein